MTKYNFSEGQSRPVLTSDGRKWCQLCLYCSKQIDFLKASKESYIVIGEYVRHKKCLPPPMR